MNALGSGLIWCGAQVSLLALAGAIVYLVLRRRGPAAGSLAASAVLASVIGLSALAVSPWPTWWRAGGTAAAVGDRATTNPAPQESAASTESADRGDVAPSRARRSTADSFDATSWARNFWTAFCDGLAERAASEPATRWRWPGVVAWLLIAGMAIGLIRLTLGLLAVARYRRRTRPIADTSLAEALGATCRRLGCRRAIELRESARLASPATVGWRRPLILLPPDWREWSGAERQAVLAHEVAHVRRGDFLASLVAQCGLALHFCNPLVHWLARRLRIEQELAADAWGATATGGSAAYLTSLAALALRQDNRTIPWAATPFLPARGTLLRRIEMLRDKKQPHPFTFSLPKQVLVWSSVITIGLFIAGLRGPNGAAGGVAMAQAVPPGPVAAAPAAPAAEPIGLDYVPAGAALVVAVRPGDLLNTDAGKLLTKSVGGEIAKAEKMLGLPIGEIDHAAFVMTEFPGNGPSRIILRAIKPHDWTRFAAMMVPDPVEVASPLAALAGKKYFKPAKAEGPLCYFLPDDRTVVFAPEAEMRSLIADAITPGPKPTWAASWRRAATGNLAAMLDVERLRRSIGPRLKQDAAPLLAMFGPVWTDSQRLLVGADMSNQKLGILALDECSSADAASGAERTVGALITIGLNELAEVRKIKSADPGEVAVVKMLAGAAEDLLKQAHVSRDGNTVVIKSEGNGTALLAAASIALPALRNAREAAHRAQSMNNLKQLALAMMNYEAAYGHLPPAVVMGPDGKTPHSWRVELLPYLDLESLYKQYKMNEPWDSPANKKVSETVAAVFLLPGDSNRNRPTDSGYFVLTGKGTMFSGKDGIKLSDITGGTSNTIMIVEAKREIPWTKPDDIPYDPDKPLPKLGGIFPAGFCAAFADGSVRFFQNGVDEKVLRAFIGPSADAKAIIERQTR